MSEIIICRACGKSKPKSVHHILPQRFFGKLEYTCDLCEECHANLESSWIPLCPVFEPFIYWEILNQFLICNGSEPIEPPFTIPEMKKIRKHKKELLRYQKLLYKNHLIKNLNKV